MSEAIQLPAVPTDGELSKEFPSRPDWPTLSRMVGGITGRDLFDDHDFGPGMLANVQHADAAVRDYLKAFDKGGAWWDSPYGKAEKALKEAYRLFSDPRIAEENRGAEFRKSCKLIMDAYVRAHKDAEAAAQRQLEQKQREDDEWQRDERLREIEREKWDAAEENNQDRVAELNAEAAHIESTPIIPTVVTPAQAAAAVGLPAMPKTLVSNKKPIYERTIVDSEKFIKWLAANTGYIGVLFDKVTQRFSFTNIKHSPIQIDGVSMGQKSNITNRGK